MQCGRTQEILYELNRIKFDDDVKEEIRSGDDPLEFKGLQFTKTAEESKALNETGEPMIVISASGMCDVRKNQTSLKTQPLELK